MLHQENMGLNTEEKEKVLSLRNHCELTSDSQHCSYKSLCTYRSQMSLFSLAFSYFKASSLLPGGDDVLITAGY